MLVHEVPGFSFLPPLVPEAPLPSEGPFETGAEPTVEIAEIDGQTGAAQAVIARWSPESSEVVASEVVSFDERENFYFAAWQTPVDGAKRDYRISVSVAQQELGWLELPNGLSGVLGAQRDGESSGTGRPCCR